MFAKFHGTRLLACSLLLAGAPALAQSASWTDTSKAGIYCDHRTENIRMFGAYPGKTDAPMAIQHLRSAEARDTTMVIDWKGPGQPRLKAASVRIEDSINGAKQVRLSIDGVVMAPKVFEYSEDEEDYEDESDLYWVPASEARWLASLSNASTVKVDFLDDAKKVLASRHFSIAGARLVAQEANAAKWLCR